MIGNCKLVNPVNTVEGITSREHVSRHHHKYVSKLDIYNNSTAIILHLKIKSCSGPWVSDNSLFIHLAVDYVYPSFAFKFQPGQKLYSTRGKHNKIFRPQSSPDFFVGNKYKIVLSCISSDVDTVTCA